MRSVEDLLQGINIGIAVGLALSENKADTIELYKNIMTHSVLPAEDLTNNYTNLVKEHANKSFSRREYNTAVLQYLDVFKNTDMEPDEYRNTAICLFELNQTEAGLEFLKLYENTNKNSPDIQKNLGQIYFNILKDYPAAINHYEKYIQLIPNNPEVFNILGHLYSIYYKDKRLEKQLEYFMAAHKIKKNTRLYIRNIIFTLFRLGRYEETEAFYQKLLTLNPEHADYYYYGCFLISQRRFKEGYKYLQHRFEKEGDDRSIIPAVLPREKYWHGEDLTGKTVLVHCEQGFGDSIMYSRLIKEVSRHAKKIYFVVQDELFSLMNNSNLGAEIYSTKFELSRLEYDFFTTTVDLALYLDINPDELPFREGYLTSKTHNSSDGKFKIGFAYKGSESSKESARDLPREMLLEYLKSLKDVELYSLQVGEENEFPDNITNLGKDFKNFEDTANAINKMDIVISTDNAILNLAGALGKPTFGIFNRYPEYRWYNIKEGVATPWYQSVTVFQNSIQDEWTPTLKRVCKEINRIKEGLN